MVGIYRFVNEANGKSYVGQSKNLDSRFLRHIYDFKKKNHYNKGMQEDCNNGDGFVFEVLERCLESELDDKEIFWISHYDTVEYGYNKTYGGHNPKLSEDTKKKMSDVRYDGKFRGSNLKQSKLTEKEVAEIKALLVKDVKNVEIADMFGVSQQVIAMIKKCICWKYVRADLNDELKGLIKIYNS